MSDHAPRLLADIGGTNARFALETQRGCFDAVKELPCADYPNIDTAIEAYLLHASKQSRHPGPIRHAAIAIAAAVDGDVVSMTNHHWQFSIEALRRRFDLASLLVVNDFTALALALPQLSSAQRVQVGGGQESAGKPIGLVGPGTGLGVSGLVRVGERWEALATEGGHVTFSPADATEIKILEFLWNEFGHVSAERLISGSGLELIHRALGGQQLAAAQITAGALDGDEACARTVDRFCGMLGTVAGNVALTLGASGVYIGGGIIGRLGPLFERSPFRVRFEDKGRLTPYLARIPTFLITEPYPAFLGVSKLLADHVGAHHPTHPGAINGINPEDAVAAR